MRRVTLGGEIFELFLGAKDLSQIKSPPSPPAGEELIQLKSSAPMKSSKLSTRDGEFFLSFIFYILYTYFANEKIRMPKIKAVLLLFQNCCFRGVVESTSATL